MHAQHHLPCRAAQADVCAPYAVQSQQYVQARIQVFAAVFARRAAPHMTPEQVDYLARDTVAAMVQIHEPVAQPMPQQSLRLVLRHDCQ